MIESGKSYELDIRFKGGRKYLQGGDIAKALIGTFGPCKDLTIRFHKMMAFPIIAQLTEMGELNDLRKKKTLCAIMQYTDKNRERRSIAIIPKGVGQITLHYRDNEKDIIAASTVCSNAIEETSLHGYNFFDRIVALNKHLLNRVVEIHPWIFSRIDLNYAPVGKKNLVIELEESISQRTFVSIIYGDGIRMGRLFFSRRSTCH